VSQCTITSIAAKIQYLFDIHKFENNYFILPKIWGTPYSGGNFIPKEEATERGIREVATDLY